VDHINESATFADHPWGLSHGHAPDFQYPAKAHKTLVDGTIVWKG
jgi:hypothetical protein